MRWLKSAGTFGPRLGERLRREAIDGPGTVSLSPVTKAIVEAIGSTLPKFQSIRFEPITAPMRRKRNLPLGETLLHFFETRLENTAGIDHVTLLRSPGAELRADRSGMKILLGFFA